MVQLRVKDVVPLRVLVTRESAHALEAAFNAALQEGLGELDLDFSGIDGVTPSFLDELLAIWEKWLSNSRTIEPRIVISNSPTRLSSKFAAISRGRGMSIEEADARTWVLTKAA